MLFTHQKFHPKSQDCIYFSFMMTKKRILVLSASRTNYRYSFGFSEFIKYSSSNGKALSWGQA
jgi:hypothetical protein